MNKNKMENFLKHVQQKVQKKLKLENIQVIDNSYLHKSHKSFVEGKFHLKLIIESNKLKNISRIETNRLIFAILKDEMKEKIHALEIEIE